MVRIGIIGSSGLGVDRAQDAKIEQGGRACVGIDYDVVGFNVAVDKVNVLEKLGGRGNVVQ